LVRGIPEFGFGENCAPPTRKQRKLSAVSHQLTVDQQNMTGQTKLRARLDLSRHHLLEN
jgi:hypothetical protein